MAQMTLAEKEDFIENFLHYLSFYRWYNAWVKTNDELIKNLDRMKEEYRVYVKPAVDVIKNKFHYNFDELKDCLSDVISIEELSKRADWKLERSKYSVEPPLVDMIKEAFVVQVEYWGEHMHEYLLDRLKKSVFNDRVKHRPGYSYAYDPNKSAEEIFADIYNKAKQARETENK